MGKSLIIKGADFSTNGIAPEYQKLAWIGASNESGKYIASGLYFGNKVGNLDEELEFSVTLDSSKLESSASGAAYSMGSGKNTPTTIKAWFASTFTDFYYGSNGTGGTIAAVSKRISGLNLWDNQPHIIKINKNGGSYDGTDFAFDVEPNLQGIQESDYNNTPIYLDCYSKPSGGSMAVASATEDAEKIHWVKYRRNGVLILDAIPVRRNSDGKIGFYDLVNDEYHFRNNDSVPVYGL